IRARNSTGVPSSALPIWGKSGWLVILPSSSTFIEIIPIKVEDDGKIPNHPDFPLLIYKSVFEDGDDIPATLNSNGWSGEWLGSVHPFHHYHSNTTEVIAVKDGHATLQLRGTQSEGGDE